MRRNVTYLWILGFLSSLSSAAASPPVTPFVEFLGQRFLISDAGISASGGIGFRASDQTILSEQHTEICGGTTSQAVGDQGVAVDPLTDRFWHINSSRVIREVTSEDPYETEIVFEIPATFDVPGVGPSTLYSPRGLALDDTYVYVVDSGPDLGEQYSNQWFKFTRNGTPVSSSALTDFADHLDFGLDSVVDGIHRIPDTAPYGAGLFLVAVEHSGILVIDENGFFIERLSWEEEELPLGAIPFAFSGVTMDPDRGDLYIVENSGSRCFVWNRLPATPTPVIYLPTGNLFEARGPDVACPRRLILPQPADPIFGIAYEPVGGLLWAVSFNTGEVFAIDPRSGFSSVAGTTLVNIWGFTWDPTREVFHAHQNGRLFHVDPVTFDATPLTNVTIYAVTDITYSPDDDALYGVAFVPNRMGGDGGTDRLVRFDPDTGASTIVGVTVSGYGIAYDPTDGRLLLAHREGSTNEVYAIDPATGASTLLDAYGHLGSSEALAIIPSGDAVVHTGDPEVVVGRPPVALMATPNPTRGMVSFEVRDEVGNARSALVFDTSGRRVRALPLSEIGAGLRWDGRTDSGRAVAPGVYYVRVKGSRGEARGQVVIAR